MKWPKTLPTGLVPIEFGDHMTMARFVLHVESGCFVDSDGFGQLATATGESPEYVLPSHVKDGLKPPEWATHVVWYNR